MTLGDTQSYYAYTSDNTKVYNKKLYDQIGAASNLDDSSAGAHEPWPWKARDMRHVTGVTADGAHRSRLVVDPDDDRFKNAAGTWTAYGKTYTITGAEGERRPSSHVI